MLTQPVVAHCSVIVFHIGVLLRLVWLYVVDTDSVSFRPNLQAMADRLGTVVAPYGRRLAAPFHDLFQDPDDAL